MIRYISTRGASPPLGFFDVVLTGLAPDGGLYVPETLSRFSASEIAEFGTLDYVTLAQRILAPFVGGELSEAQLRQMLEETYASFRHTAIAPLVQVGHHQFILELFHGATLAFKDFALQFLGRLLDHILRQRGERATVIGATSGDTGSAAIAACAGRDALRLFILHPHGRVSEVQRRQMTTVADANVHNLAVQGTFDDCQDIVKTLFGDAAFRESERLVAVNSINWARICAQVVYYFYAACALGAPHRRVSFSVPTGNFGDIYAGYIAKRLGLPVERLVIATNRNDILTRCLNTGAYAMESVSPSLSPSMDIQISSNFERLLFDLHGRNGKGLAAAMQRFRAEKRLALEPDALQTLRQEFSAQAVDDAQTLSTIAEVYAQTGYLADPHTAVGLAAAFAHAEPGIPMITLATAHPAKFPEAVERATGVRPALPPHMRDLFEKKERYEVVENNAEIIKAYIAQT